MPAGPPPTTSHERRSRAGLRYGRKTDSRPASGFTVQWMGDARMRFVKQPWLARMQCVISSSRPERTFSTHAGSASCSRVRATTSAWPAARIASTCSGRRIPPTRNTGVPSTAARNAPLDSASQPSGGPPTGGTLSENAW